MDLIHEDENSEAGSVELNEEQAFAEFDLDDP